MEEDVTYPAVTLQHDWHQVVDEFLRAQSSTGSVDTTDKKTLEYKKLQEKFNLKDPPKPKPGFWVNITSQSQTFTANCRLAAPDRSTLATPTAGDAPFAVQTDQPADCFTLRVASPRYLFLSHLEGAQTAEPAPQPLWRQWWVRAPAAQWLHVHPNPDTIRVLCLDVNGDVGLSGAEDGSLRLWDLKGRELNLRKDLKGHVMAVNTVRFFPSTVIALSGGADMQLRVWSVNDGKCHRALKGHTRSITSCDIVGVGKQVVSSGLDCTVRLWECGSGETIRSWESPQEVNHVLVLSGQGDAQVLSTACEDGFLRTFDVRVPNRSTAQLRTRGAANVCAQSPSLAHHVFAGTQDGFLHMFDMRQTQRAILSLRRSDAALTSLQCQPEQQVWAASGLGACSCWDLSSRSIVGELSGIDFEPIYATALMPSTGRLLHTSRGAITLYDIMDHGRLGKIATSKLQHRSYHPAGGQIGQQIDAGQMI
eukprot:g34095.t1